MAPYASLGTPIHTGPVNALVRAAIVAAVGTSPDVEDSSFVSVIASWKFWTPPLRVTPRAASGSNHSLNARTCHAVRSSGAVASGLIVNAMYCQRG
jgi:hypothetical protein